MKQINHNLVVGFEKKIIHDIFFYVQVLSKNHCFAYSSIVKKSIHLSSLFVKKEKKRKGQKYFLRFSTLIKKLS
jgi:hypothetical protein